MKVSFVWFIICLLLFLPCQGQARGGYVPAFVPKPGTAMASVGQRVFDVARHWCRTAPGLYYVAKGYWPESWSELRASGIFTAELISIFGEQIDPDDPQLGFAGDLQYLYKGPQTPPQVAVLSESGRVQFDRIPGNPTPYSQRWLSPPSGYPIDMWIGSGFPALGRDSARFQQMAVQRAYHVAAEIYLDINGRFCDWQTLQSSGFGPHAPGTVNPLTGEEWAGDGRPNDLLYECATSVPRDSPGWLQTTGGFCFRCLIVDKHGRIPWEFR